MKKVTALLLMFTFVFALSACTGQETDDDEGLDNGSEDEKDSIVMITDVGDIDDESFNQGTWEGIKEYAEDNDIPHAYYKPEDVDDDDYIDAIELAIDDGADVVVTPGYLFEVAIYQMQDKYPDVTFVLLDAEPQDGDGNYEVADNTVSIFYEEHESGFLAGYAAVKDGFETLGFMGGRAVPAVVRFGVGYIAGAHYAADEENMTLTFPDNRYDYLGTFSQSNEVKTKASSWYQDGTEIIFSAAGGAGSSVMSAAEDQEAWMIGVDVDQSSNSNTVLTSATKALANSVITVLDQYYNDEFPGGDTLYLGAAEDGVSLPMENSRFDTFDQDDYDAIYSELAEENIVVPSTYEELQAFFSENELGSLDIEEGTVEP